ncbi:MAG TPA: ABC transporter ATP-binding protein [Burkholderiales bacterium]|nr:ABC transporter ATP-binding protein [Burkholderiales bacterium]
MASITLENVTVDFTIYGHHSFRTALLSTAGGLIRRQGRKNDRITVRALDNLSMKISHGDRIGLIGHNGAGKSTLLRVLAGVYEPIGGRIITEGKVSSLLNSSPGMNFDDTGYENIMTCGLYLGMTKQEIIRKTPDIEEFTELGEYLTLPIRTYSAGMLTRLAFGIATSIEPDILLLDEGLGAGDARFIERANQRVNKLINRASILVLAAHADALIKSMCNRCILMDHGRVVRIGATEEVIDEYHRLTSERAAVQG